MSLRLNFFTNLLIHFCFFLIMEKRDWAACNCNKIYAHKRKRASLPFYVFNLSFRFDYLILHYVYVLSPWKFVHNYFHFPKWFIKMTIVWTDMNGNIGYMCVCVDFISKKIHFLISIVAILVLTHLLISHTININTIKTIMWIPFALALSFTK